MKKKSKANLNLLAQEVADLEGGKKNLSIAQIKEVLKCLGTILGSMDSKSALITMERLIKR